MTKNNENLSSFELDLKSPTERFDEIYQSLMPLMKEDAFMGATTTPNLRIGKADTRFTVFAPGAADHTHYSPSILYQRLVTKKQGVISFLAPESAIFLRRGRLEKGYDTEILGEITRATNEYGLVARKLPPPKARELGFSEEFINGLPKSSRTSCFLVKILKIAEN